MYRIERIVVKAPHLTYVTSEVTINTVEQDIILDPLDLDTWVKLYRGFKYDYITCVRGTLLLAQQSNQEAIGLLLDLITNGGQGFQLAGTEINVSDEGVHIGSFSRVNFSGSSVLAEVDYGDPSGDTVKITGLASINVINSLTSDSVVGALSAAQGKALKTLVDTKTSVGVLNVLDSMSEVSALSAKQGKVLKDSIDGITSITVVDNLASNSTTSALSANQGRVLGVAIGNKLDASLYNEYYKGVYSTSGALSIAHPTAISGSYAMVDAGSGSNAQLYWYDLQDGWVTGGGATLSNTDALLEGSTNKYFTEARVRSTILTGLSTATNVAISSSDSVLGGMGKLQAQIDVLLLPTVNTYSATTEYTLQAVDNDGRTYLRMDNGSANTVTVPSTQTKPISIRQVGTGTTTLAGGAGVTLNGTLAFTAQHQTKTLVPVSAGVFDVVG